MLKNNESKNKTINTVTNSEVEESGGKLCCRGGEGDGLPLSPASILCCRLSPAPAPRLPLRLCKDRDACEPLTERLLPRGDAVLPQLRPEGGARGAGPGHAASDRRLLLGARRDPRPPIVTL